MFGVRGKHGCTALAQFVGRNQECGRVCGVINARGDRANPTQARRTRASGATISRCVRLPQVCGHGWWVMGDWLRSSVGPQQKVQSATG